jgi:3-hydroxyacyl-CoA dehydrogenase
MEATASARTLGQLGIRPYPPFRTVTVLGAGTMGAQIAAHCANAGLDVYLLDVTPESIGREGSPSSIVEGAFKATTKMKPSPFFTQADQHRVTLGNFDDDFEEYVGRADWVIEVVVERLDIKRKVMERIESAARENAVISTNTSGIPIGEIAEGRGEDFRRRFLGTHFFNPPRYLKLLELIPTEDTDPEVLGRVAYFGRVHLGKGIVVANDVPYFVGNRVGVFAMMTAMGYYTSGDYTIEEIDALTGSLVGHPKSATFRTADVVGLDVIQDVTGNLYEKATADESRMVFQAPEVLRGLVGSGKKGAKTKAGFYKKIDGEIRSWDISLGDYAPPKPPDVGDLKAFKKAGSLQNRLSALFEDEGRAGTFFRETTLETLAYAARRIPEITDDPASVDKAIKWGFGWEMGPFEKWDALGFERVLEAMREHDIAVPSWVEQMQASGQTAFYKDVQGTRYVYRPESGGYEPDPRPSDEVSLATIKADGGGEIWSNEEAGLLDLGDGVALFEFRSKANALGVSVMQGLVECIERVENDPDLRGLVVGNEGTHFSVGANLGEMAGPVIMGQMDQVEEFLKAFQDAVQRVRYAAKPVVVAPHQRVLGGGCEIVMASARPVAAAETYMGLVELGVGLIPGGTGTMYLTAKASEDNAGGHTSHLFAHVQRYFETVAMAKVATSAREAIAFGFMPKDAVVVMNDARRFHAAKHTVVALSEAGYLPPPRLSRIHVLGRDGAAAFEVALRQYEAGGFISEYDRYLASRLAYIMTGGDLTSDDYVDEDYLLGLEREVFLSLLGEQKTQDRIVYLLENNKPLRN